MIKGIEIKEIKLNKIVPIESRHYGKKGDIDKLAKSIDTVGLIEPIVVKCLAGEEDYRLIAGGRRYLAMKFLGWTHTLAIVHPENLSEIKSDEMTLAENVNRLEIHPLDEAELFAKLRSIDGKTIEEIALYYSRSVSGIYHRLRLCDLTENIKEMFRADKISIVSASVLAYLSVKNQNLFFEKYSGKDEIDSYQVRHFLSEIEGDRKIRFLEDNEKCIVCIERTNFKNNTLFEEYQGYEDVCLKPECYSKELFRRITDKVKEFIKQENLEGISVVVLDKFLSTLVGKTKATLSMKIEKQVLDVIHYSNKLNFADPDESHAFRAVSVCRGFPFITTRVEWYIDDAGKKAQQEDVANVDTKVDNSDACDYDVCDSPCGSDASNEEDVSWGYNFGDILDFADIPEEKKEQCDTVLTKIYSSPYNFYETLKERILEKEIEKVEYGSHNSSGIKLKAIVRKITQESYFGRNATEIEELFYKYTGSDFNSYIGEVDVVDFLGVLLLSEVDVPPINDIDIEDTGQNLFLTLFGHDEESLSVLYKKTIHEMLAETETLCSELGVKPETE